MAITYPIIETQLRLIRALQKGYVEALEAGDWQAADYRCSHLHKLCEGLHHLSQLLDRGSRIPDSVTPRNANGWVSSIHSVVPTPSPTQSLVAADKPVASPPPPAEQTPAPMRDEWRGGLEGVKSKPSDEVW
jgi:hypothetical protein